MGNGTRVTTSYLLPVRLSGTLSLDNVEYAELKSVAQLAGSEVILSKDPTDFEATADRLEDGYGGWTQGLYIPSYNRVSGLFVKAYGLSNGVNPQFDSIYLRPIAALIGDAQVYPDTSLPPISVSWNPDTQIASFASTPAVDLSAQFFTAAHDVNLPSGAAPLPATNSSVVAMCHPATFQFRSAYKLTKMSSLNDTRGRKLLGACDRRKIEVEAEERFLNTLSPYIHYKIEDIA